MLTPHDATPFVPPDCARTPVYNIFVPLVSLVASLPRKQLLDVALAHSVPIPRTERNVGNVVCALTSHVCDFVCNHLFSVFTSASPFQFVTTIDSSTSSQCTEISLRSTSFISVSALTDFEPAPGSSPLPAMGSVEFVGHFRWADVSVISSRVNMYVLCIPWSSLPALLNYRQLQLLISTHNISIPAHSRSHLHLFNIALHHVCTDQCGVRYAAYRSSTTSLLPDAPQTPSLSPSPPSSSSSPSFPPAPMSAIGMADIVADWCNELSSLGERPCAVCGELVLCSKSLTVRVADINLSCLVRPDISVFHDRQPVLFDHAVYDHDGMPSMDVCKTCLNAVRRQRLPKRALANGLWIGTIPEVLQQLLFVEKIIIAKYRHNAASLRSGLAMVCPVNVRRELMQLSFLSISFLPAGGGGKRPLTCLIRQDRTSARRESRRGLPAGPSDEDRLSRRPPHQIFSSLKFF